MVTNTSPKSWGGTTCARAAPASAFKKCCMKSGLFDGSRRHYFSPRIGAAVTRVASSRSLVQPRGIAACGRIAGIPGLQSETWDTPPHRHWLMR
jgi:hypothetical protein